ncbi:BPL-N domain-containing protein [Methanoculleus chikugoensis]|uniref:BPL-N domain-containing protein n=1 Tax=Methanoculleus chikugoensis TaxID=118126 RepID=UPI001FB4045D|nr:BPL-N domain-containing protein [Methanoculleus chikugoensis]
MFSRLIEDCGAACESVNPNMLASPFWRGRFAALIVPTGFANPAYSNLLPPALRAAEGRIRRFVENGGRLLVFGAGCSRTDAYDWLPFPVTYSFAYGPRVVRFAGEGALQLPFFGVRPRRRRVRRLVPVTRRRDACRHPRWRAAPRREAARQRDDLGHQYP